MPTLRTLVALGIVCSDLTAALNAQNPPSPPVPPNPFADPLQPAQPQLRPTIQPLPPPPDQPTPPPPVQRPPPFKFLDGDRVVLLGDTLIEREQIYGYLETRIVSRYPNRNIVFRNLGWSADTVLGQSRASFDWNKGEEEWFKQLKSQIATIKPTVAILGYGMASSFEGEAGLPKFKADLNRLMDAIQETSPDKPVRFILYSPIRHGKLGAPLPDPTQHNEKLALYTQAIKEIADQRQARFIPLFNLLPDGTESDPPVPLTDNGIHLNATGYWRLAEITEMGLGWFPTTWRLGITADGKIRNGSQFIQARDLDKREDYVRFTAVTDHLEFPVAPGPQKQVARRTPADLLQFVNLKDGVYLLKVDGQPVLGRTARDWARGQAILAGGPAFERTEQLQQTIVKKNELYFHRWRPENQTYLFGFRKYEQGQNAREIPMFDPLILEQEKKIAELRKPIRHTYELVVYKDQSSAQWPAQKTNTTSTAAAAITTQANPPQPLPHPKFEIADGFEVQLFAENPHLAKPIQMNFDSRGRLWIASSSVYPQIQPGQVADDKILVLEDTDGDGQADKSTVFAEGLLIPTGVEPGDGGAYVGQSTQLLHFKDTDGDGKADQKRIVLSGFGTEDTHHIVHTLRWGPDGQLYFNQSIYIHSHLETPHGVVRLNSGGIFHLRPPTMELGVFLKGFVNSWGHDFDAFGQSFCTDGAYGEGINYGLPGAMYVTYAGARRILGSVSPGSYPKFCSLEIIGSEHFPDDWQGNLITCDFRAHRVVRFAINEQGSTYLTKEMPDLLRTTDVTFRPIDVKLGPDGALYVSDWSNPIIQHGEVDFRDPRRDHEHGRIWRITAKGRPLVAKPTLVEATNTELFRQLLSPNAFNRKQARRVLTERGPGIADDLAKWTQSLSNISALGSTGYQPAWPKPLRLGEGPPVPSGNLPDGTGATSPNIPSARLAATPAAIPVGRLPTGAGKLPAPPIFQQGSQPPSSEKGALEALWVYQSIDIVEPALLEKVLSASDARIRAAAVRVVRFWNARLNNTLDLLARVMADEHPRVRLEAMRALSQIPTARSAELVLSALDKPMDSFLDYALWLSINDLAKPWIEAVQSGAWKLEGRERQLEFGLQAIEPHLAGSLLAQLLQARPISRDGAGPWIELVGKAGASSELRQLLDQIVQSRFEMPAAVRALNALAQAARLRNAKPSGDLAAVGNLLEESNEELRTAAIRLAGAWKMGGVATPLLGLARDKSTPPTVRKIVFESLREIGGREVIQGLEPLGTKGNEPAIRREAALTLAALNLEKALPHVLEVLADTPVETDALALWRSLLSGKGAAGVLARSLAKTKLPASVAKAGLRAAREGGRNEPDLVLALTRSGDLEGDAQQLTPAEIQRLVAQVTQRGDPARGERIFRRAELTCVTCHAIGGVGGKAGPDLTSIGASAPIDYLIESLLYPNRKVKEGFHSIIVETKDGLEFSGIPVRETSDQIVIRDATNKEVIVAKNNVEKRAIGGSIMPSGLTDPLTGEEQLDLYRFLSELGKPGPYDASKGNVARLWKLLAATIDTAQFGDERVLKTDLSNPSWSPAYALVDGRLSKDELLAKLKSAASRAPSAVYAAAQFQIGKPGPVQLQLGSEPHAGIWIDGQAVASRSPIAADLSPGTHTIVIKLEANKIPEHVRLETSDGTFLTN